MDKLAIALLLLLADAAAGATWYASATGSETNGTSFQPWSPLYAVTNTNPHLQPGDTVIFKNGGPWHCPERDATATNPNETNLLVFRKSGTPSAKITYCSETLWGFEFDGGLYLPITTSNLVIYGVHVSLSYATNRIREGRPGDDLPTTHGAGISENGRGNELLHNLIENVGHPGIASWGTTYGKKIQGNIIRFVGNNDFSGGLNGDNRGSGQYLQNYDDNGAEALIEGNISYYNYTTGMKAYATGTDGVRNFRFVRNFIYDTPEAGIFLAGVETPVHGLTVQSNVLWSPYSIKIGYGSLGGHSNAVIGANYCVGTERPLYIGDGWRNCTVTNNFGFNPLFRFVANIGGYPGIAADYDSNVITHTFANNEWWSTNNLDPWKAFTLTNANIDFPTWTNRIGTDASSTHTYGTPSTSVAYAFRPSGRTDFVHVSVFNWGGLASTNIDLSAYFSSGDSLSIYDAQNIPTAYTNITYDGGALALPLNLTNYAPMLGTLTNMPSAWSGFPPQLRTFVVHKTGVAGTRYTHTHGSGSLGTSTR